MSGGGGSGSGSGDSGSVGSTLGGITGDQGNTTSSVGPDGTVSIGTTTGLAATQGNPMGLGFNVSGASTSPGPGGASGGGGSGGFGSQQGQASIAQSLANSLLGINSAQAGTVSLNNALNSQLGQVRAGGGVAPGTTSSVVSNPAQQAQYDAIIAALGHLGVNPSQLALPSLSVGQTGNQSPTMSQPNPTQLALLAQLYGLRGGVGSLGGNAPMGANTQFGSTMGFPSLSGASPGLGGFGSSPASPGPSLVGAAPSASPTGGPGAGISGNLGLGNLAPAQAQALAQMQALTPTGGASPTGGFGAGITGQNQAVSPAVLSGLGGYTLPQVTGSGRYS